MKKALDGVGVGAIVFNEEGKLFMAKRGPKARSERGKWECPGGGLERWESFAQCIEREFMEEFGAKVKCIEILPPINHLIPKDDKHWVAVPAVCKLISGTPKILEPEKCAEIGWFSFEEIKKMPLSVLFDYGLMGMLKKYHDEKFK